MLASRRKTGPSHFFEYFLLISLYLLISTATEHLYKSGIQDRQNKVWESDSNMLTLLTLSTTFVGPTLEKSYQAASHFCSGMALMLGPNFVGFDLKARRLYPTNMGFNPLDSIPRGIIYIYIYVFSEVTGSEATSKHQVCFGINIPELGVFFLLHLLWVFDFFPPGTDRHFPPGSMSHAAGLPVAWPLRCLPERWQRFLEHVALYCNVWYSTILCCPLWCYIVTCCIMACCIVTLCCILI